MFAKYECIVCVIEQLKNILAKNFKTLGEKEKFEIMRSVSLEMVKYSTYGKKPIEMARIIYEKLEEYSGTTDYFKEEKKQSNDIFLEVFDEMYLYLKNSDNPLKNAAKLTALGNLIDYGVKNSFGELEWELENILKVKDFTLDEFNTFKDSLTGAKILLYIHDNAGEVVLDKLFIKILKEMYPELHIISAVRGAPIINDVTLEDAEYINLNEAADEVISSGGRIPGTLLSDVNQEFLIAYKQADIIISKGQGNFEGLSEENENIYFVLMAKCPAISRELGINVGDLVFSRKKAFVK
ncbi:MAG: hypothetical protein B6I29_03890 [Marinitoga sp. 4572_148]|nr:MAG: hypothetical protein B6I29_03890 [Marinitoga sp. 4572_148]